MTKLKKGDVAPNFSGLIAEDKNLNLEDLNGKFVVLYFYPKDNTPGCTTEAKDFNALKSKFAECSAEIIGVSKDSLKSHDKFRNNHELTFDLISDTEGEICEQYGVWVEKSMFGKKYMGIKRASFLINPDGIIEHVWPSVSVKGHAEAVLKKVQEVEIT